MLVFFSPLGLFIEKGKISKGSVSLTHKLFINAHNMKVPIPIGVSIKMCV